MAAWLQWIENRIENRPARWLITLVWLVFFIVILVQPENKPLINTGIPPGPQSLERDIVFTFLHVVGFGITAALLWWAFSQHLPSSQAIILAVIIALLLGVLTEWLQGFTPDRHPQLTDFIADAVGAWLVYLYEKRRTQPHNGRIASV